MKNLLFTFLLLPIFINAQQNCRGSFTEYYLNSNNIRASFFPRGNKFTDGEQGGFLAPYPSQERLSFQNDLQIGSEDLVVYREGFLGINDPVAIKTSVYPGCF